jgi:hypothetical protein
LKEPEPVKQTKKKGFTVSVKEERKKAHANSVATKEPKLIIPMGPKTRRAQRLRRLRGTGRRSDRVLVTW